MQNHQVSPEIRLNRRDTTPNPNILAVSGLDRAF